MKLSSERMVQQNSKKRRHSPKSNDRITHEARGDRISERTRDKGEREEVEYEDEHDRQSVLPFLGNANFE